ncbi:MAG: ABC transporter substrate-binding protein [Firmicutes bacterium]|jgi:ABC-type nitrate/sulfonate/bicarbonate transport system substrate-binding protein|nr:ABC transporter substrate-binding protein [Bacillota bacterium]
MKKVISLMLTLIMISAVLAGCRPKAKPEPQSVQELEEVTVLLDWTPNTNYTGMYVADAKGYYQEEGLKVKFLPPAEGSVSQLTAAGKTDFGISYQEEVTYARVADMPVKAVAAIIQHNTSGLASPEEKGITTPKDFEGKRYGGWGSPMEEAVIKAIMAKHDADFSKVRIVNIGSTDFFAAVKRDVDFAWIFWGWAGIEAELRGMKLNFIKVADEDPAFDYYTPVLITNEDTLNQRPELVKKFLKATSRGYEFAIAEPQQAAELFLKAVPELNRDLVLASQEYLAKEYQADAPRWGEMKESVWKDYADFMFENGLIEKNIDPKAAFTNEFLPEK